MGSPKPGYTRGVDGRTLVHAAARQHYRLSYRRTISRCRPGAALRTHSVILGSALPSDGRERKVYRDASGVDAEPWRTPATPVVVCGITSCFSADRDRDA